MYGQVRRALIAFKSTRSDTPRTNQIQNVKCDARNKQTTQEAICYAREIPVWGEDEEETDEGKCLPKEGKALLLSQVRWS